MELRRMVLDDLPAADALRKAAGWNQTGADWRRLLAIEPEGCFVAVDEGRIIGSGTTTSFGTALAWIGMILVDPDCRGKGVGRQLMNQCIGYLQSKKVRCIKLDATPAGRVLYEKLGFQVEWALDRWMNSENTAPAAAPALPTIAPADWPDILALDLQSFGVDRSSLLRQLGEDSTDSVIVRNANGSIEGFGLLRPGINADYLGPIVATTDSAGKAIATRLLGLTQRPVYWDIPAPCVPAVAFARQLGFTSQRPLFRMHLGPNEAPGLPERLWAISDPATG